jgi:predicted permease
MQEWFSKLRTLFRRTQIAGELREEMDAHLEMEVRENLARGMTEEEARASARRHFGSPALVSDRAMDTWTFGFWDILLQDIRYAARTLRRTPAFTVVALLSLAVGIGASTAIFSLMNALFWRKLPVAEPDRLVIVWPLLSSGGRQSFSFYHSMFRDFRQRSSVFDGVSASWFTDRSNVILDSNGANAGALRIGLVSGDYFATLGVRAALGRTFTPDDDRVQGGAPVSVISHGFWRSKFNGNPDIVGRTLRLNQTIFTIIGVAASDFHGDWPGHPTDLWFPMTMTAGIMPEVPAGAPHPTRVFARLKHGITLSQAQAASQVLYQQLLTESVTQLTPKLVQQIARERLELQPAGGGYAPQRETLATPVAILTILAVLMLFSGWANVASLWLARSLGRQREMAVRAAIGAGRVRILRQAVTETALLSVAGGLIGVLFASVTTGALTAMLGSGAVYARSDSAAASIAGVGPDLYQEVRVFGFTALVCMVAGLGFGIGPALRFAKTSLAPALTDRGGEAGGRGSARKLLVVVQVCVSMILLCGAALFLQTLANLKKQDLGFDREHLLVAYVDAAQTGRGLAALASLAETVIQQMLSVPGVQSANIGVFLSGSMGGSGSETIHFEGKPPKPGLLTARTGVMPGYFATVGTPLIAGREFSDRDTPNSPRVAVINQTMAHFIYGDENPIGRRMGGGNEAANAWEIVGIVKDLKSAPRDHRGIWYVSDLQQPNQLRGTWGVTLRISGDPRILANTVRQRLKAIDPALPVFNITTVDEQLDIVVSQERLLTILSVSFAFMATVLACIGLYGMMAYTTASRTREFGIRIALGATPAGVRRLVLQESSLLALAGIAIGIPLTIAGARAAAAVLFGVGPSDLRIYALAGAVLMLVAASAGIIPANKASRVDPSDALRHD